MAAFFVHLKFLVVGAGAFLTHSMLNGSPKPNAKC